MADPNPDDIDPLPIPPFDDAFFADLDHSFSGDLDDLDFTFDGLELPSDDLDFLNSLPLHPLILSPDAVNPVLSDSDRISADHSGDRSSDVANFLNASSPDSPQVSGNKVVDNSRVFNYPSPGPTSSQGSGSGNSASPVSTVSSPNSANNSTNGIVDQKIKLEEELNNNNNNNNNSALKRKKESENGDSEIIRTSKYHKSEGNSSDNNNSNSEEEKKKARLMRNRESAQLSRQRKKHYVEELEDKVRAMHSTIQDLNSKITYIMAENATLRQQVGTCPPPPPGMYPHHPPPMGYPWIPPPYVMKPQGSQVPLVPIPRLKPQQPAPAPKAKRAESKSRIKKVASVSFLGLFFFMLLFCGLVPMVNVKFREMHESVSGGMDYFNSRFVNGSDREIGIGKSSNGREFISKGHYGGTKPEGERGSGNNSSEPLVASLYVPRNDKLVKIDGNLIIHSVIATEKAKASSSQGSGVKRSEETGLAVARNVPSIIPLSGRNRHPHPYRGNSERRRALSGNKDNLMSSPADGKLQQWFREGLAGPMLSSGMCTEVFQFDVSPAAGAIVPVTSIFNATSEISHPQNTSQIGKGQNRRILRGVPVPLVNSKKNITEKPVEIDPEKDNFKGNKSLSSMIVSVLVDPREAGDGDSDGVMGHKSLSRIFVVVLIDSVKYVTYSCMLPLMGSGPHLVTT